MDGYDALKVAIIRRAVSDYNISLRKNDLFHQKKLEKFFLSEWGQMLSDNYGEYIIEQCKKECGKGK